MPPVHLLNELRHLVPSEFESKLSRPGIYDSLKGGWTAKAKKNGLLFDLSRVEWVEFGTLVQLVLLIESALMDQIAVSVALPIGGPRYNEEERLEYEAVLYQIDRRRKVLDFLDYLGFVPALQAKHLSNFLDNLTILPDYDPGRPRRKAQTQPSVGTPSFRSAGDPKELYKFFVRLTWLSKGDDKEATRIAKFLAAVVGERERGLEAIDADAISNVILYELIDNVQRHAGGSGYALVAAWARHEERSYNKSDYIDCEQDFIQWLSDQKTSSVEIVVGDSGKGIPKVLEAFYDRTSQSNAKKLTKTKSKTTQILQWALDRWSTSREIQELRGTRGLYRVDRVVSKYQGIITLRSENAMAGLDHGGASFDKPIAATQSLSHTPGTILRCRMPSFREDLSPRISVGRVPRKMDFDVVKLGEIGVEGIPVEGRAALKKTLSRAQTEQPLCVIGVVEGTALEVVPNSSIERTLRQCVEIRHPGTLVILGLPGGWDLIEGAIASINLEHKQKARGRESANPEHFEIWDAVLIIGPQGQFKWVGANIAERIVLDHLLGTDEGVITTEALKALVPNYQARASTLRYFRGDTNLIRFSDDGSNLELMITGAELINFTKSKIDDYLLPTGVREGILTGDIYRTPSLLLVNRWLNVERIVEKSCGGELLMFALVQLLKRSQAWDSQKPPTTILADSTVSSSHLKKLREYLGKDINTRTIPGETGAPTLPGARVLPDNARVIVYCDVMAASEAVGRSLRLTRKEGAQVVAVLCVIDARITSGQNLALPGIEIPVITLTSLEMIASEDLASAALNISPITRNVEEQTEQPIEYEIAQIELTGLIAEKRAFHFSHIGREIGRHFTFYMNAILEEPLIIGAFNKIIDNALKEWRDKNSGARFREIELWYPSPELKLSEPARRFAESIKSRRSDVKRLQTIRRVPAYGHWVFTGASTVSCPVVVIDWGAITGSTVTQAIRLAANAGAHNVLVVVFLSQLKPDEELFLRNLRMVRGFSEQNSTNLDRVSPLLDKPKTAASDTEVIVTFLAGFPIEAYTPYECPVCLQLSRLSQENYPTELLRAFAKRQEETRLRLRTREEVINAIPHDFDNRPMSIEATMWMMSFRGALVRALGSTAARFAISQQIHSLISEIRVQDKSPREVLWLLQFLSIESQWLRRPPLYFRQLREATSNIALSIALDCKLPESDRLNAVIILRTSNKSLFAKSFSRLFEAAAQSEDLITQLLYDAFTYVDRPYHQTEAVFKPLRDQLRIVRDVMGSCTQLLPEQTSEAITETVSSLLQKAETRLVKAQYRALTPIQSWNQLRRILVTNYQAHRAAPESMLRMLSELKAYRSQVELLRNNSTEGTKPLSTAWLSRLQKNWNAPRDFLGNTLLELLAPIRTLLKSEDAKTILGHDKSGRDVAEQLIEMIDANIGVQGSEFSRLIKRISEEPMEVLQSDNWERLQSELDWFWEIIFRPPSQNSEASRLIRLIEAAPRSLGAIIKEIYNERKDTMPPHEIEGLDQLPAPDLLVFCPEGLLSDVVGQVLGNLSKHQDAATELMRIRIQAKEIDGRVQLVFWNDSTKEEKDKDKRGIGLESLKRRLRPFQGDLQVSFRNLNGWATAKVAVVFAKGE